MANIRATIKLGDPVYYSKKKWVSEYVTTASHAINLVQGFPRPTNPIPQLLPPQPTVKGGDDLPEPLLIKPLAV